MTKQFNLRKFLKAAKEPSTFSETYAYKQLNNKHHLIARRHADILDLNLAATVADILKIGDASYFKQHNEIIEPSTRCQNQYSNLQILFPHIARNELQQNIENHITHIIEPPELIINKFIRITVLDNELLLYNLPYYFFKTNKENNSTYIDAYTYSKLATHKNPPIQLIQDIEEKVQNLKQISSYGFAPSGKLPTLYTKINKNYFLANENLQNMSL